MIKKYNSFIKESVTNKGKGPGNNDLFTNAPKKQTINQSNQTVDFLRIGKHIKTNKIDGFIDSVQNKTVYIADRLTGEIQRHTFNDVLKGIQKEEKGPSTVQGFEGTPAWAKKQKIYENIDLDDDIYYNVDDIDMEDDFNDGIDFEDNINIENIPGDEEEYEDIDLVDDIEDVDDIDMNIQDMSIYGTEDNPEGLPNGGAQREMPNESWVQHWNKYNQKTKIVKEDLTMDDEDEQEYEAPIMRGTEDNPIPSRRRRRPKIESYD